MLIFYRSGGAIASQLAHHWHAVVRKFQPPHLPNCRARFVILLWSALLHFAAQTPMDPQDIIDDVARIAAICYPTHSAVLSAYAAESQREARPPPCCAYPWPCACPCAFAALLLQFVASATGNS